MMLTLMKFKFRALWNTPHSSVVYIYHVCLENYVNPHPGSGNPGICKIHQVNQHLQNIYAVQFHFEHILFILE
jgi:hypothetical protein